MFESDFFISYVDRDAFSNAHAEGPMQAGQMIVQLYGMIDLDDDVPVGTPHLLDARMMG